MELHFQLHHFFDAEHFRPDTEEFCSDADFLTFTQRLNEVVSGKVLTHPQHFAIMREMDDFQEHGDTSRNEFIRNLQHVAESTTVLTQPLYEGTLSHLWNYPHHGVHPWFNAFATLAITEDEEGMMVPSEEALESLDRRERFTALETCMKHLEETHQELFQKLGGAHPSFTVTSNWFAGSVTGTCTNLFGPGSEVALTLTDKGPNLVLMEWSWKTNGYDYNPALKIDLRITEARRLDRAATPPEKRTRESYTLKVTLAQAVPA